MRPDFAHVARQRGLRGNLPGNEDIARLRRQRQDLTPEALNELPRRWSMRPKEGERRWGQILGSQLKRYLCAQIGRPWNDVYSEVRAALDGRRRSNHEIIEALRGLVRGDDRLRECRGDIHNLNPFGVAVDPESGLIVSRPNRRFKWARVPEPTVHTLGPDEVALPFRGQWFAVRYAQVPLSGEAVFDVYRREELRCAWRDRHCCATQGCTVWCAVHKRQLSRREIRAAGLPPIPPDAAGGSAR